MVQCGVMLLLILIFTDKLLSLIIISTIFCDCVYVYDTLPLLLLMLDADVRYDEDVNYTNGATKRKKFIANFSSSPIKQQTMAHRHPNHQRIWIENQNADNNQRKFALKRKFSFQILFNCQTNAGAFFCSFVFEFYSIFLFLITSCYKARKLNTQFKRIHRLFMDSLFQIVCSAFFSNTGC